MENLTDFFWSQLMHDINQLSNTVTFGGQEDAFIILHILNSRIAGLAERRCKYVESTPKESLHCSLPLTVGLSDSLLRSNQARMVWESTFIEHVLRPVLLVHTILRYTIRLFPDITNSRLSCPSFCS